DLPLAALAAWARSADLVVAADGAADRLRAVGITPAATIGDLDSLVSRAGLPRVLPDPDQATSDCDKLLAWLRDEGHRDVTLIGAEGDRIDHTLGAFLSAARFPALVRFAMRRGLGWVLTGPSAFSVGTVPGELVSLLPLETCSGVGIAGVRWP